MTTYSQEGSGLTSLGGEKLDINAGGSNDSDGDNINDANTVFTDASGTVLKQRKAAEASVNTSNYVYIRSDDYAWIPGRVVETVVGSKDGSNEAVVSVPQYRDEQSIHSNSERAVKRYEKVTIDLGAYPNQALPLQNVDEDGKLREVEDMVDLPFLHEAAILYNLKARHQRGLPYTRTGDIVIACNPYNWIEHLYNHDARLHYANALIWRNSNSSADARQGLKPHIYESSALAYRGLAVDGEDQSILVSGESGAGKTESVKICLNHLASIQRNNNNVEKQSPIVQRVLDSNPLLEAFGNAKTVRNDNSSRFGKYISLQFDTEDPVAAAYAGKSMPLCVLAGSTCEVYLLEKSRVVMHEEDERTYHIFYQLLAASEKTKLDIWQGLEDTDNESFSYVGYTDTDTIEGMTDGDRFEHTVKSLALVGIKEERLQTLMRAICIVLQLGNIIFETDPKDDRQTIISSKEEFDALSDVMGIAQEELLPALTIRTMRARNEEFKVPLNDVQAKDSCDAFAKEIYAKAFLWLVRAINDATSAERNYDGSKTSDFGVIGLLDIFGFESFEVNRFEQLCINYANEKLQQKFTQDIFMSVQKEYEVEGIELEEIRYDDNTDVLDLVEGRMGLLAFLNEECLRPGGSDKSFVSKVYNMNKDCSCFIREKHFGDCQFGVHHYAGPVIYDATNFVTKNMDTLPSDLQDCATNCKNEIISHELQNDDMFNTKKSVGASPSKKVAKKKKVAPRKGAKEDDKKRVGGSNLVGETVWTKFRGQLNALMTNLGRTRTRYIRCIKPNTLKQPLVMHHVSTVGQLRCAGVVAAVTISRSAFPNRLEHRIIIDRFKPLWKKSMFMSAMNAAADLEPEDKEKKVADILVTHALKELELLDNGNVYKAFVVGRTRTYFRAGALETLEASRMHRLGEWAMEIQKNARMFMIYRIYRRMRRGSVRYQSLVRGHKVRVRYLKMRAAAIVIENWHRRLNAKQTVAMMRRNFNATVIQKNWRTLVARKRFVRYRNAAIAVQKIGRGALQRPKFRSALHEKREEAKLENQVLALQRKLEEAERRRLEVEKAAEEKARQAVEDYREKASTVAEERKDGAGVPTAMVEIPTQSISGRSNHSQGSPTLSNNHVSAQQQQNLMDESGKMLEYLRKEVFKLRTQNTQMRTDFDLLKDNNQRLMDANASAGASFAALNTHAKQLKKNFDKVSSELLGYKSQVQKLSVVQVELKEELKMKQATYTAEVHSRLQYHKALSKIVDMIQERCRDSRLVEDVLSVADECEADYMSGPTGMHRSSRVFATPNNKGTAPGSNDTGIMSSIRSFWS